MSHDKLKYDNDKLTKYKKERFKEKSIDWKESWWGYWWIVRVWKKNTNGGINVGYEITQNQKKNGAFLFSA